MRAQVQTEIFKPLLRKTAHAVTVVNWPNFKFLSGRTFTVTATLADGSSTTGSTVVP